jgi:hypothetical protein
MKDLLLQELNPDTSNQHQDNVIEREKDKLHDQESQEQLHIKSGKSKRLNTPNFKYKEEQNDEDI